MNHRNIQVNKFTYIIIAITVLMAFTLSSVSAAGLLKVYYVRHGEAGHNVVNDWKDKPKAEWPLYVGNSNIFTPKGESQVAALTEKLKGMNFDFIATSPSWRARNTVLPYLKSVNLRAEIWPELGETVIVSKEKIDAGKLPPPGISLFKGGDRFNIPQPEAPFFIIRPEADKQLYIRFAEIVFSKKISVEQRGQADADAIALAQAVIKMVKSRFAGFDKTILLVGHGEAGITLLRVLTEVDKLKNINNTGMWMAEEQSDGSFIVKIYNDKPCNPNQ